MRELRELFNPALKCERVGHDVHMVVRPANNVLGLFNASKHGTRCKRCSKGFTIYGYVREL